MMMKVLLLATLAVAVHYDRTATTIYEFKNIEEIKSSITATQSQKNQVVTPVSQGESRLCQKLWLIAMQLLVVGGCSSGDWTSGRMSSTGQKI